MRLPGLVTRPLPQRRSNGRKLEFDIGIFFSGATGRWRTRHAPRPIKEIAFCSLVDTRKIYRELGLAGTASPEWTSPLFSRTGSVPLTDGRLETCRPLCGKFCRLCRYISLVFGRLLSFARPDEKLPTWTMKVCLRAALWAASKLSAGSNVVKREPSALERFGPRPLTAPG